MANHGSLVANADNLLITIYSDPAASDAMSAAQGPQPPGTFLPGTKVTVGSHRVTIEKYLSEGGFAHVYVVRVPRDNNKYELAVLKRVAVPDKAHLAAMRTEVETMKRLRGHRHIVTYLDSHASGLLGPQGGYEVFLLMEYCAGGGLIDFMNTRLQHRLTEPEILKIFADVAEGVAAMHYLKPPLLHRDLKVENVLISKDGKGEGGPLYKVCDFGSAATPCPAATTAEEGRRIEEDVQKHTTFQYRSPEMIDVWRKHPIDEKSDIWALGVLLYKLCYYTTPFEDVGQMAILNASFKYPPYPAFSERIKKLIAWMLKEDPRRRPTIFQVVQEVCSMRGTACPIKDIYANRTASEARRNAALPPVKDAAAAAPAIGLTKAAPEVQKQAIPDIAPMRRGRPGAAPAATAATAASTTAQAPARGDPFAALDSKNFDVRAGAVDELSKRFPSLEEFSITQGGGAKKFAFSNSGASPPTSDTKAPLNERVANALADEVFSKPLSKANPAADRAPAQPLRPVQKNPSTGAKVPPTVPVKELRQVPAPQPSPGSRIGSGYRDTGTGTSPPLPAKSSLPEVSTRPIWKVPEKSSSPRFPAQLQNTGGLLKPGNTDLHRSKSQTESTSGGSLGKSGAFTGSNRPSLEGQRPSARELEESSTSRDLSADSRGRVTSMYVSDMDYLRSQEQSRSKRPSMESRRHSRQASWSREPQQAEDNNNKRNSNSQEDQFDDKDLLRPADEGGLMRKASGGKKHGHQKRSSMSALGERLKGGFSDAFKRFEGWGPEQQQDLALITPTPGDHDDDGEPRLLSPIAGSEAALSRTSDFDSALDETEDLPPEVRRELERQRLSQEERRVAEAAAEHRARVAAQSTGSGAPMTRANAIQQRVENFLREGRQSPAPKKTASGYGHYSDAAHAATSEDPAAVQHPANPILPTWTAPPIAAQKPAVTSAAVSGNIASVSKNPYPVKPKPIPQPNPNARAVPQTANAAFSPPHHTASAPAQLSTTPTQPPPSRGVGGPAAVARPSAPPKPKGLRTGGGGPTSTWPPPNAQTSPPDDIASPAAYAVPKPSGGLAALLAKDLEGVPDYPPRGSSMQSQQQQQQQQQIPPGPSQKFSQAKPPGGPVMSEIDEMEDFSKRYPSLSGIEMVETEISGGDSRRRVRNV